MALFDFKDALQKRGVDPATIGRYTGWMRTRGVNRENAEMFQREGRKMLAAVLASCERSNVPTGKLTKWQPDGSLIIASFDGVTPMVEIISPPEVVALTTEPVCDLWLPRGFVLYPSSTASTTGWGTPVVQVGTSVFAPENTAPGVDVARWTPGGSLGEVLLTTALDAGYGPVFADRTPLMFSVGQSPRTFRVARDTGALVGAQSRNYTAPKQGALTAYRAEFDGFTFPTGAGGVARQALFTAVNAGQQYCLPLRGYYDPAFRDVSYTVSADFGADPWITDHALAAAPVGYVTAADRKGKDGIPDPLGIDVVTKATVEATIVTILRTQGQLVGGPFDQARTTLSLAQHNGLTALTAIERAQWIAYGVRYWVPVDTTQPILSWDGHPSWNWHIDLILGVPDGSTFRPLDWYTHVVRGASAQIFSKRLCANGREIGRFPAFVISAGLQARTVAATDTVPEHIVDRILVLTWQLDDQDDSAGEFARVLRLWFLDVPRRNNVPLALSGPADGLYDATTNPGGWHYADKLQLWDRVVGVPTGFLQPPVFSPDGKRIIAVPAAFDEGYVFITTYVAEAVLNTVDDGVLDATVSVIDSGGTTWALPRSGHSDPNGKYPFGVDYQPDSFTLRAVYYAQNITFPSTDVGPAMRWTGDPSQTGGVLTDHDLPLHDNDADGFTTSMLYVQDPLSGAMFLVDQHVDGSPHVPPYFGAGPPFQFRFRAVRAASAPDQRVFPDANSTPLISNEVLTFSNGSNVLPCFARNQAGDYIAGYEMCPAPAGTEATHFESSLGDLAALTMTPGDTVALYPIGAV